MVRGYALCDTRIEAWLFKAGKQVSRQADATPPMWRFPLDQEIANVTARLPYLDFSTATFPFSPSASGVSFTCLPSRHVEEKTGRFQSPRGRFSTAPRHWMRCLRTRTSFLSLSLARRYAQLCEETELENLRAWNTHLAQSNGNSTRSEVKGLP